MHHASTANHPKDPPQIGLSTSLSLEQLHEASSLLKALANENRLTILYLLRSQERSVLELAGLLGLRQPTVSQHLARLRDDNVVKTRRNGQVIYYSLESDSALQLIDLLEQLDA